MNNTNSFIYIYCQKIPITSPNPNLFLNFLAMAPKRQPQDLPLQTNTSESESEDQEHSSSSDDDSDSEPQQLTQSKPHQDSSESDSDSSSDEIVKTPSVVASPPKKPTSKSTKVKANGKRPAETEQMDKASKSKKSKSVEKVDKVLKSDKGLKSDKSFDKSTEKSKISNGDEEGAEVDDKKASYFTRVFTDKDEIVLLEGMIEYKEKEGVDPTMNIGAFHESVEDLLSCSVAKNQIVNKIRGLKKKFMKNVKKGRNGEDPVFSKPHDYKSFELSKKIWESEANGDSKVKSNSKKDGNVGSKTRKKESDFEEEVMDRTEEDCWSLYPRLCEALEKEAKKNVTGPISPKKYMKKVVSGLKREKARELEQDWEGFIVLEHQVYVKRTELVSKQAELISKQAEASMNMS